MELQLYNLGFSLVWAAIAAAVLAGFLWFALRIWQRSRKPRETLADRVRMLSWAAWTVVAGVLVLSAAGNSGPRITVSDHYRGSDQQASGEVRNLAPSRPSDEDREKENRTLQEDGQIPRQ